MALTQAEKHELIITHADIHHELIGTMWKYIYKNGKGYVIYDFETAVTLTWNSYDNDNNLDKTYTYQYIYEQSELKIIWNPKNTRSGFDIFEVKDDKIIGKSKKIVIEKM